MNTAWPWDNSTNVRVAANGNLGLTVLPFGELLAEPKYSDVTVNFHYPFYNTEFDMRPAVIVGGATATVADGYLELVSATAESVTCSSKNAIRYIAGHSGFAQFTASFSGTGIGTIGAWEAGEDGFFIRVENGQLQLGYEKDGSGIVVEPLGRTFHGGTIPVDLIDLTSINIFRILFGYLGVANPVYEIKLNGRWYVLGTIQTEGKLQSTHITNPVLPITIQAQGDMEMRTASWSGGRVGGAEFEGARFFSAVQTETLSGTNLGTVGTFRNKTTYKTLSNRVKAKLLRYSFHVDAPATGSGTVQIRIIKNAVTTGIPVWNDIDADNSVIEADTVANYDSGGRVILISHVGYSAGGGNVPDQGGTSDQDANSYGLFLLPGETATITVQNVAGTQNVTTRIVFNWIELF